MTNKNNVQSLKKSHIQTILHRDELNWRPEVVCLSCGYHLTKKDFRNQKDCASLVCLWSLQMELEAAQDKPGVRAGTLWNDHGHEHHYDLMPPWNLPSQPPCALGSAGLGEDSWSGLVISLLTNFLSWFPSCLYVDEMNQSVQSAALMPLGGFWVQRE